MQKLMSLQSLLAEVEGLIQKYDGLSVDTLESLRREVRGRIYGAELQEVYGLDLGYQNNEPINRDWVRIDDYRFIAVYGEERGRTISWEIDGKKPDENTTLVAISFPTGAYIFNTDKSVVCGEYPTGLFARFFDELKSYSPDFVDDANSSLYWKLDNAKAMFNDFPSVLDKYMKLNLDDAKQRRIDKMKAEVEKMEMELTHTNKRRMR